MAKSPDDRSATEKIALFRRRAQAFTEHPSAGAFTTVRTTWSREGGLSGTRIDQMQLESMLLRARVFDERNDKAVALTTMNRVLRGELVCYPARISELDEMRRRQKQRRRQHLRAGATSDEPGVLTPEDLVELSSYGNVWHLDPDKQRRHDDFVDAGAKLLLHQAQLLNLQLLLSEVRETSRFIDRCEAAGVQWSTS